MILSLCLITKGDEELEKVKRAVGSVIDHVENVYITTNSKKTKKTVKWCNTNDKIHHSHLDWNENFAEQRNFNFSQVSEDTDFIVWMDSDDIIVNPHILREVAELSLGRYDTVFFTYFYGAEFDGEPSLETFVKEELVQNRERLIKPGSIVWKKRIHETPVPVDPENFVYSKVRYSDEYPIVWLHLGADRDLSTEMLQERLIRNRRLLEAELKDERERGEVDPRTLLYLMKIYAEEEPDTEEGVWYLQECLNMGEEYISSSGWDEERAVCYKLMGICMGKLGDHSLAVDYYHKAIEEYPKSPLLYLHLARAYYNLGRNDKMKHWMRVGMSLDMDEQGPSMSNVLELKLLSTELLFSYYYYVERNIRKAYEAAVMLNEINPTEQNQRNVDIVYNQKELDLASENAHKLMNYYKDIKREDLIPKVYEAMPEEMKRLPFANRYYNRFKEPKVWEDYEICYFANFGGEHFEKWDGYSREEGIGGSETAVIALSEEWTKMGYKVTVYGDPVEETTINGVTYKPWYKFNNRDRFNIFIQWRSTSIVDKINAKKIYVDLHDVFVEQTHKPKADNVDKFMVKSKFHREYAPNIPDEKMEVVSNGIKTS